AAASELEFFLYRDSYEEAHIKGYRDLKSAGWYVEDYHLLQGARVEDYVGAARRVLAASGVPVENSKGEAAIGQHELNIRYTDVLAMADRHVIMKQAMKELADQQGVSVTFMAKPDAAQPGNSCHLHLSLWQGDTNAFVGDGPNGRSDLFRWFLGGWMKHCADLMPCYAPTVNSYKRYQDASWAPTRIAWSTDNRTAGFRIVGTGSGLRIENRIPGGDVNPYLAFSAALASGLDGIANQIEPPDEFSGDVYAASDLPTVPHSLEAANARFAASTEARRLLGDQVVDHYSHFFSSEVEAHQKAVTDWEHRRYFERI
ncbi:MAG: glutamine synthetase, partial [Actinobacteria bacterium]|nr:glutamine synthetase [Actinomycetota bacterium]MBT7132314.1 glutamine synthetase [Actinomycetota bacterium]MBT7867845.1 glutamine synthetase [Actinomycetota bacterium]